MIEAIDIVKSFDGIRVLDHVNATFADGKVNMIIGQSGSGKTVLLKSLLGIHTIDSGRIEYDGRNLPKMKEKEVRYEMLNCEDAEYIIVAYGSSSRIAMKAMQMAREKGIKVGLFRLITLFPFPTKQLAEVAKHVKGILCVEMSAGQMIEDVRLATACGVKTEHFGRFGGIIPTPGEVLDALENKIIK